MSFFCLAWRTWAVCSWFRRFITSSSSLCSILHWQAHIFSPKVFWVFNINSSHNTFFSMLFCRISAEIDSARTHRSVAAKWRASSSRRRFSLFNAVTWLARSSNWRRKFSSFSSLASLTPRSFRSGNNSNLSWPTSRCSTTVEHLCRDRHFASGHFPTPTPSPPSDLGPFEGRIYLLTSSGGTGGRSGTNSNFRLAPCTPCKGQSREGGVRRPVLSACQSTVPPACGTTVENTPLLIIYSPLSRSTAECCCSKVSYISL